MIHKIVLNINIIKELYLLLIISEKNHKYTCKICKKEYVSEKNLKIHTDKFHKTELKAELTKQNDTISCQYCNNILL